MRSALVLVAAALSLNAQQRPALRPADALRVSGNHLVNAAGQRVRLYGFDSSAASSCVLTSSTFVNELPLDAQVVYIASTGGNTARISINEACWLGINGLPAQYTAGRYRSEITTTVKRLHEAGFYVLLTLHWNAAGSQPATKQQPMPDADHSPAFWKWIATDFKNDPYVFFELYNEPRDVDWKCWRDGCQVTPEFRAVGMQSLVNVIRATGAKQPIIVGGLNWANDLSGWLEYRPKDPLRQLVASLHEHNGPGQHCLTTECWDRVVAPVARQFPVLPTEIGDKYNQQIAFTQTFCRWADANDIEGYIGWRATRTYAKWMTQHFAEVMPASPR